MAGSTSKQKGSRFEYKIRDHFNKLYETQEFQRTPGSGAIVGRSNFQKKAGMNENIRTALGSDLICPDWFKFSVECKNYNDKPSFHQLIQGEEKILNKWLGEVCLDAKNFQLTPMLLFNSSRKGIFVVLPRHFKSIIENKCDFYVNYHEFVILSLSEFDKCHVDINELNNTDSFNQIQNWLNSSDFVNQLLTIKSR